jgi:hypothetical protein
VLIAACKQYSIEAPAHKKLIENGDFGKNGWRVATKLPKCNLTGTVDDCIRNDRSQEGLLDICPE